MFSGTTKVDVVFFTQLTWKHNEKKKINECFTCVKQTRPYDIAGMPGLSDTTGLFVGFVSLGVTAVSQKAFWPPRQTSCLFWLYKHYTLRLCDITVNDGNGPASVSDGWMSADSAHRATPAPVSLSIIQQRAVFQPCICRRNNEHVGNGAKKNCLL